MCALNSGKVISWWKYQFESVDSGLYKPHPLSKSTQKGKCKRVLIWCVHIFSKKNNLALDQATYWKVDCLVNCDLFCIKSITIIRRPVFNNLLVTTCIINKIHFLIIKY